MTKKKKKLKLHKTKFNWISIWILNIEWKVKKINYWPLKPQKMIVVYIVKDSFPLLKMGIDKEKMRIRI